MIREIVKDLEFLSKQSEPFSFEKDKDLIADLLDTATSFGLRCAGLAAIQIGSPKKAIVIRTSESQLQAMVNPIIFFKKDPYISVEGCLSLEGEREVKRYKTIKVSYLTPEGKSVIKEYRGYLAKVIQHEVDHLKGILI